MWEERWNINPYIKWMQQNGPERVQKQIWLGKEGDLYRIVQVTILTNGTWTNQKLSLKIRFTKLEFLDKNKSPK